MKKLCSIVLALILVMSLAASSFAVMDIPITSTTLYAI